MRRWDSPSWTSPLKPNSCSISEIDWNVFNIPIVRWSTGYIRVACATIVHSIFILRGFITSQTSSFITSSFLSFSSRFEPLIYFLMLLVTLFIYTIDCVFLRMSYHMATISCHLISYYITSFHSILYHTIQYSTTKHFKLTKFGFDKYLKWRNLFKTFLW